MRIIPETMCDICGGLIEAICLNNGNIEVVRRPCCNCGAVKEERVPHNIKRTFVILNDPTFISCSNCGYNYSMGDLDDIPINRRWCQDHSHIINPTDTEANYKRAMTCEQWIPYSLPRSHANPLAGSSERWYEKD